MKQCCAIVDPYEHVAGQEEMILLFPLPPASGSGFSEPALALSLLYAAAFYIHPVPNPSVPAKHTTSFRRSLLCPAVQYLNKLR